MAAANTIAIIILAAGESARLGSPKQLLQFGGNTLLQQSIEVALNSIAGPVLVVLGANEEQIKNSIEYTDLQILLNVDWKEGMASSIRCGIKELIRKEPIPAGVIIMLCDQPYVTAELINDLVFAHEKSAKKIVASNYNGILGAPTFFHKDIFPDLLQLKGDVGARAIIRQHKEDVEAVAFPAGRIDIDTAEDYKNLANDISNAS